MDILAHGLWTAAAAKLADRSGKTRKPVKIGWTALWGVFPDVFAFAPLFTFLIIQIILGNASFSHFPGPDSFEPAQSDTLFLFKLTGALYSISHSLLIFGVILGAICLVLKKFPWEMLGWAFHILIDIPTHSYAFYPTPFLWPLSDLRVDGLSWASSWFVILNYSALAVVYIILWKVAKKKA
jgi:hypothetical protein